MAPDVVTAGNAAAELVEEGVNGTVAASPAELGAAIVRALEGGEELHRSTAAWYAANAERLSAASSAGRIREELART